MLKTLKNYWIAIICLSIVTLGLLYETSHAQMIQDPNWSITFDDERYIQDVKYVAKHFDDLSGTTFLDIPTNETYTILGFQIIDSSSRGENVFSCGSINIEPYNSFTVGSFVSPGGTNFISAKTEIQCSNDLTLSTPGTVDAVIAYVPFDTREKPEIPIEFKILVWALAIIIFFEATEFWKNYIC